MNLKGKRVLVTGGTGSLGSVLVKKMVAGIYGTPSEITVFSRDEDRQHQMRRQYGSEPGRNGRSSDPGCTKLRFRIGDVRDYAAVSAVLREADIVFHTAALKQVPSCEYAPSEALLTNAVGARNIVRAISEQRLEVEVVVGISTDKACEPINVMGMTKALQERILIEGNLECPNTRFICVRYGNVVASRGSVVPAFLSQIRAGSPVTVTTPEMTRFLITLDQAVDTISAAVSTALPGEIYVPVLPSARIVDVARVLIGHRDIPIAFVGIRPGEKVHEVLVSEVESYRTIRRDGHLVVLPVLSELVSREHVNPVLDGEFSSRDVTCSPEMLENLLAEFIPEAGGAPARVLAY